jgi:hypothetical protein
LPEVVHKPSRGCDEGKMQSSGRRFTGFGPDDPEIVPLDPVLIAAGRFDSERGEGRAVEALRCVPVGRLKRYVVEQLVTGG